MPSMPVIADRVMVMCSCEPYRAFFCKIEFNWVAVIVKKIEFSLRQDILVYENYSILHIRILWGIACQGCYECSGPAYFNTLTE